MNHHRQGAGRPLVLIHGIGSRWQVWQPVLPELTARYDVIALDLPGFGESPLPAEASGGVPALADQVAAFLTDQGIERPVIGGSSLGGGVALELGRRGLAAAVVAFSPVGFFGSAGARWCRGVVGAARSGGALLGPAVPRLMATRAGRIALCGVFYGHPARLAPADCVADARALVAAPGFARARRSLGEWRVTEDLAGIPITIAWGTRDLVLPYRQAARARSLLPEARHVRLAGCGHLPFADDPRACADLLLDPA
ncbi:MAG: alpha/beta fold hydrolase [Actinoplanes sp.]